MCIIRSNDYLSVLNEISDITATDGDNDNTADGENNQPAEWLLCHGILYINILCHYAVLTTTLIVKFSIPNKLKIIL